METGGKRKKVNRRRNTKAKHKQARNPETIQKRIANSGGRTDGTEGIDGIDGTDETDETVGNDGNDGTDGKIATDSMKSLPPGLWALFLILFLKVISFHGVGG